MIENLQSRYGFSRMPFTAAVPVGALFASAAHKEAAARLRWLISAYLHCHVTASGSAMGRLPFWGRASLCSLALIAAGSCERPAGSGGAKRPRSGAAGALDAVGRERIMAGGGKGANRGGRRIRGWFRPFSSGTG